MQATAAAVLLAGLALACTPAAASRPASPDAVSVRDIGSEREVSLEVQELI